MAKFKHPTGGRVSFGSISQTKMNTATSIDSTAVSKIAYNPKTEELVIRFKEGDVYGNKGQIESRNGIEYTYKDVPVSVAQKLVDAEDPRRRKVLPPRARSVGATMYDEIRSGSYEFTRMGYEGKKDNNNKKK